MCCDKLTVYPVALVVHCQLNPQARPFVSMPMAPKLILRRGKREEGEEHVSKHQLRSEKYGREQLNPLRETRLDGENGGNEDRVKCHKGGTFLARKRRRRGRA